ncbi:MAG: hypothetical protein E5W81_03845 [Mesorhizobium sp.]|nr:MAG: hypothetical protein E5W81_03845 [Mesorhizobium sp.]
MDRTVSIIYQAWATRSSIFSLSSPPWRAGRRRSPGNCARRLANDPLQAGQPNVLTLYGVLMHSSRPSPSLGHLGDGGEVVDTNEVQGNTRRRDHIELG